MANDHFTSKTDEGHLKQFSETAAAGQRRPEHGTLEELRQRHEKLEEHEAHRQATVNADPVPTGTPENVHADEGYVPKDTEINPEGAPQKRIAPDFAGDVEEKKAEPDSEDEGSEEGEGEGEDEDDVADE